MSRWARAVWPGLALVLLLSVGTAAVWAQGETMIAPKWNQGQNWVMNVSRYQQQVMGKPYWTNQLQWRYQVIGQDDVQGLQCQKVTVKREGALKDYQTMYYQQNNKQLVKCNTQVQVGGQYQDFEQWVTPPGSRAAQPAIDPPLSVMPAAMPVFAEEGGSRALPEGGVFRFTLPGSRGLPGYNMEIKQSVKKIARDALTAAFTAAGARSLADTVSRAIGGELFEIELDGRGSKSIQRWSNQAPFMMNVDTQHQQNPIMKATLGTFSD